MGGSQEGVIERYGDGDEPTVTVGDSLGTGHGVAAFGPAGVRVPPGTTVTWEWSGHGDPANVVALDDSSDSGDPVAVHGHTFSHTFEESGVYRYACAPHHSLGEKGAIVVE